MIRMMRSFSRIGEYLNRKGGRQFWSLLLYDFSVGLIFNLLRQIVFEFINSECGSRWMLFGCEKDEDLLLGGASC